MKEAPTAYSLLIMHRDVIYAVRDPYGNRPLCIGRLIPVSDINDKGRDSHRAARAVTESWFHVGMACSVAMAFLSDSPDV